jgi:GDP-L-fucose synthase
MDSTESILITGGSGFLGRAVSRELGGARSLSSRDLDLTDGAAVGRAIAAWRPRIVIHLAARVGGISANTELACDLLVDNLRIDANVLSALRIHPPEHFIPILSTCMYPDRVAEADYPMTESMMEAGPAPPSNAAYAAAKRALWQGARALHQQYHVPFTAFVPSNLYGAGDHFGDRYSHFLAAAIVKFAVARRSGAPTVEFFGTGTARRQYLLANDLAKLIARAVEKGPLNLAINVAPRESRSIAELATAVAEASGFTGEIRFSGSGPDGQFRKDVSTEALRRAFPEWSGLETPFETGLQHTVAWYREHVEAG